MEQKNRGMQARALVGRSKWIKVNNCMYCNCVLFEPIKFPFKVIVAINKAITMAVN